MQPSTIQVTVHSNPAGLAIPRSTPLSIRCLESDFVKRIILAPVPCRHLDSALRMQSERIAFGTDATHFFLKNEEIKKGIRVLIYASRKSAGAAHLFVKGCATFEARYEEWLTAVTGKHPVPDERASSTVTDTPFEGFWVVSAFKKLPKEQWVAFKAQGYGFQSALENPFSTRANDCSNLIKLPEGEFHDRSAPHWHSG